MTSITRSAVLRPIYELFEQGTLTGLSDEQLVERFVARRDEAAFEALVVRHGHSVLAVCHAVLRDDHDAEDAFQATFLILAQKAGSLWVCGSLAAWLHRVARRVSVEASERKVQRHRFEKTGLEIDAAEPIACDPLLGLMEILHEEIDRLPENTALPSFSANWKRSCATRPLSGWDGSPARSPAGSLGHELSCATASAGAETPRGLTSHRQPPSGVRQARSALGADRENGKFRGGHDKKWSRLRRCRGARPASDLGRHPHQAQVQCRDLDRRGTRRGGRRHRPA